jgi:hypothetical protein
MKTNCIICDVEIANWDGVYPDDSEIIHPISGTVFRTYGHYGSGVFDPMDASYMEIVVCDGCLKSRLARTYSGVNEQYKQQLAQQQAQIDEILAKLGII